MASKPIMPFHIQGDAKFIRVNLIGEITLDELGEIVRQMARLDAGFAKAPNRLTDLSAVEKSDFNFVTVEHLAKNRQAQVYPNRLKAAIVAPSLLHFGLARMFQTLSQNPQVDRQVFKTVAEAEDWLALDA